MKLVVTVDTEADDQWDYGVPITTRNVAYWPRFQHLCERHGVQPTYLVASEITQDERARELLARWSRRGAIEIGSHLHPWTTPPFVDRPGLRYNDPVHAYPSQLPAQLLEEKTRVLTEQVGLAFGVRPTAYRAGRCGLDLRGARCLAALGYVVDSSVTPLTSWSGHPGLGGEGGPDFRAHAPDPFWIADIGEPGLMEVPVTVMTTYGVLRAHRALLGAYRSLPVRAVRRLLLDRWLRPQPLWLDVNPKCVADDLARLWTFAEACGLDTGVMIFHSSELMPGGSPFRPDERSVAELLSRLDAFFGLVRSRGDVFTTLTPAARELAGRIREVRPL